MAANKYRGINDPARVLRCRNCDTCLTVADAIAEGAMCPTCGLDICVYCGCSDDLGCVHPDFPDGSLTCEWVQRGQCSFCFNRLAEEQYHIVNGETDKIVPLPILEMPAIVSVRPF